MLTSQIDFLRSGMSIVVRRVDLLTFDVFVDILEIVGAGKSKQGRGLLNPNASSISDRGGV